MIERPDLRSVSEDIGQVEYMSIDNEVEAIMEGDNAGVLREPHPLQLHNRSADQSVAPIF